MESETLLCNVPADCKLKNLTFQKHSCFKKYPSVAVLDFDMKRFISLNRYSSIYCVNSGNFTL